MVTLPAAAAAVAVGAWITRTVLPFLAAMFRSLLGITDVQFRLDALHTKHEELAEDMRSIIKEFKPNSGETVRDALNRIEANVDLTGERQRARMLDTKDMLFETDKLGNVVWVNRTIVRTLGRLPGELFGNGWLNVIHASEREAFKHEWLEVLQEGRELETLTKVIEANGNVHKVMFKAYLMHDITGLPLGWLASFEKYMQNE